MKRGMYLFLSAHLFKLSSLSPNFAIYPISHQKKNDKELSVFVANISVGCVKSSEAFEIHCKVSTTF